MDLLNSNQISEWEAYDRIDPIGTWRDDFRTAKMTALIQNIVNTLFCEKGKKPTLISPIDEMPDWTGDKKEELEKKQTVEEMKSVLFAIAAAQNKRVERMKLKTTPPRNLNKQKKSLASKKDKT